MLRLQQLTGPVMAKGLEDTVFYRYYPLASLNEVGGRPTGGGIDPARAARLERAPPRASGRTACRRRRRTTPSAARTCARASTCCRRSRASGSAALRHWQRLNRRLKSIVDDVARPERQRGVPHLPDADRRLADGRDRRRPDRRRARGAARAHPRLHDQGAARGEAAHQLDQRRTRRTSAASRSSSTCSCSRRAATRSSPSCAASSAGSPIPGICNSLAQLVLKITAPGVPDVYQGTELWDLSLVDPDNRRPVDFAVRRALVAELTRTRRGGAARAGRELLRRPGGRRGSSCW